MDSFWHVILRIVGTTGVVLTVVWLWFALNVVSVGHNFTPTKVQAKCAEHRGVRQVEDVSWFSFENGDNALVVCADGTVRGLR
jgi:hypothetical protein